MEQTHLGLFRLPCLRIQVVLSLLLELRYTPHLLHTLVVFGSKHLLPRLKLCHEAVQFVNRCSSRNSREATSSKNATSKNVFKAPVTPVATGVTIPAAAGIIFLRLPLVSVSESPVRSNHREFDELHEGLTLLRSVR